MENIEQTDLLKISLNKYIEANKKMFTSRFGKLFTKYDRRYSKEESIRKYNDVKRNWRQRRGKTFRQSQNPHFRYYTPGKNKFTNAPSRVVKKSDPMEESITFCSSPTLMISNLHNDVKEEEVTALFEVIGRVKFTYLHHDSSGDPTGTALVEYYETRDALLALQTYHLLPFDGIPMRVRMVSHWKLQNN